MSCDRDGKNDGPAAGPVIFFEARSSESGTLPQKEDDSFGVFGYYSSGESLNNVFTGYDDKIAKVVWDAEEKLYVYENLATWSEGTYSFYAYYPYEYKNGERIAVADKVRYKTLQFVQPNELSEMVDLMTASVEAATKSAEPVRLQFRSRLFGVDVVIANHDDVTAWNPGITVLGAEVRFKDVPASLEFDIDGTGYDLSSDRVEIVSELLEESAGLRLEPGEEHHFTRELGSSFLLIPSENIKYSLSLEYVGADGETYEYRYPEDEEWASFGDVMKESGKYTLVINTALGTPYEFTASLVADWEDRVDVDNDFN